MEEHEVGAVIRPQEMGPIDREQFAYAFELANKAGSTSLPEHNP